MLPAVNVSSQRPLRMSSGTAAAIGCGVRITGTIASGGYTVVLPTSADALVDLVVLDIAATDSRTTSGVLVGHSEVQLRAGATIAIDDLVAIADTQGRWGPATRLQRNVYYVAKQAAATNGIFWARPIVGEARVRRFVSTIQTGTGASQNIAHGLGSTPISVKFALTTVAAGGADITPGTHTATNVVATVTAGAKFMVEAEVY